MTKSKTVILWGPNDLLAQAMEFFLTAGATWEVVRISSDQGDGSLMEQVQRTKPDVVILYQRNFVNDAGLPTQLIQAQPNLKVVTASLENNLMQVYSKHSIMIRKVSDLLSIIEDRYFSDYPV